MNISEFLKKATVSTSNGKMTVPQIIIVTLLSVGVLLTPQFLSNYRLNLIISILTAAYFAQCWNLMSGYTRQFSFGHAAFY